MKYDVTFTEQAENDLRGIFEYISIFIIINPMRHMRHLVSYVFFFYFFELTTGQQKLTVRRTIYSVVFRRMTYVNKR